jgi:dynein assembly factor 3
LLFLHIWLSDYASEDIEKEERVKYFLELFGNTLIPHRVELYLSRLSKKLSAEAVEDSVTPFIDYSALLKNKERDQLDEIFSEWRSRSVDIALEWDERLRQTLKTRYDHKKNIFDWDYQMALRRTHPLATIIAHIEYENWRDTGISFQFWDEERNIPNQTLASNAIGRLNNRTVQKKGYHGDMKISPYITFGIVTDEACLYEKKSDIYQYLSRDIAKSNVMKMMEAVQSKKQKFKIIPAIAADDTAFKNLCLKSTLKNKIDRIYVGNMSAHLVVSELNEIAKDDAILTVESARYMLILNEEQKEAFKKKVDELSSVIGWSESLVGQHLEEPKLDPDLKRPYFPDVYEYQKNIKIG